MVLKDLSTKSMSSLALLSLVFASGCSYKPGSANLKNANTAESSADKNAKVQKFEHQSAGPAYENLLKKLKENFPRQLKGYQSKTLIDGITLASGNFERESTLEVNLETKTAKIRVIDPPKKDGAIRKSGSLTTILSIIDGKVWIEQTFDADKIANWKLPVNVEGDSLSAPADQFQYLDQSEAAQSAREKDLTYNLKKRTAEAGFKETVATSYKFVFGIDAAAKEIYFDREVNSVTEGETVQSDDPAQDGKDLLKDLKVRLALTADANTKGEE